MNINATLIGQTIAFIIFVWFCVKFVWPPIISAIEERQKNIAESLSAAELAKKEVLVGKEAITKEIEESKIKAQQIIDGANKRRKEILDNVRLEAEEEKQKILQKGYNELLAERKKAEEELKQKLASLIILGAEKVMEQNITKAANSDIIDNIVAKL